MANRDPRWRQNSPKAELIALVSSLEGHTSNREEGISNPETFLARVREHIEQIKGVLAFKDLSNWP